MWFIIEPINADSDEELKSAGFIGKAPEYCTMNDFFGSNQGTLYIDNGQWEEGMTLEEYVATCDTISPSNVCYYSDFTSSGYDKAWLCGIPSENTGTIYAIGNTYELDGLIHPEEVLFWEVIAWS
jgi:hypothetical protein